MRKIIYAILFSSFLLPLIHSGVKITKATYDRYEAEDAFITNAEIKPVSGTGSYAQGVSGTGFVGFNGGKESNIAFTVNVNENGLYQLYIKYAVGMNNSALKVYCNNNTKILNYPKNNGWGSFINTDPIITLVKLYAGSNAIELSRPEAEKYGEIDYIEIGDCVEKDIAPDLLHGVTWKKIEAESGEVVLGTRKTGNASGSLFVGNLDFDYSYIDFNIKGLEPGAYEIKIKYATQFSDRTMKIFAGERGREYREDFYGTLLTSPTDWGSFVYNASCFISLKENSFIRINTRYVEIDYIELSNRVGDYFDGLSNKVAPDSDITDGGFVKLDQEL